MSHVYSMCHRDVAWISSVTYVCALGMRGLRTLSHIMETPSFSKSQVGDGERVCGS